MLKFSTISISLALFVSGLALSLPAQATTYSTVTVRIETPDNTIFSDVVYVADDGCMVTDSAGIEHTITQAVALCALEAAAQNGDFEYTVDDSNYGLYLSAIKNSEATATEYWLFDINYQAATAGVTEVVVTNGDHVLFKYGNYPNTALKLSSRRTQVIAGQKIRGQVQIFNDITQAFEPLANAVVYIADGITRTTNANGRFSFTTTSTDTLQIYAEADGYARSNTLTLPVFARNMQRRVLVPATLQAMAELGGANLLNQELDLIAVTEWAAIGLASTKQVSSVIKDTVLSYEPSSNSQAATTEIARHILALIAVGENPRNTNGINFIERLQATEHNNQYGSVDYVHDDIFAGLALLASGESAQSEVVKLAVTAASAGMNSDGGVSYAVAINTSDVDTTAYYIQLLQAVGGHNKPLRKATHYLTHQQNLDGGFGYSNHSVSNASSTAVALQALGERGLVLARNKRTGFNFLEAVQRDNGAFQYDLHDTTASLETLNTAYALSALMFTKLVESSNDSRS